MDISTPNRPVSPKTEDSRSAVSQEALEREFLQHLFYMQGKFPTLATQQDYQLSGAN